MTQTTMAGETEKLERFLKTYTDRSGVLKYRNMLSEVPSGKLESLLVHYDDLYAFDHELAAKLLKEPDEVLKNFDEAAFKALGLENPTYAEEVGEEFKVRIRTLPEVVSPRGVTTAHLDRLVSVNGLIVRTSELKPLAVEAVFVCRNGHPTPTKQEGLLLKTPPKCDQCEEIRSLELDERQSKFIDYQVIRLQELPEQLPPGQLPQAFDARLTRDLVNRVRPGDRVILTAIVRAEPEYSATGRRFRVFRSRLEGNNVEILGKEPESVQIGKEDERKIREIAQSDNAYEMLIQSVAPGIHGYETQKECILLLVTGSPQRILPDGTTIRGDLNSLFVGDPGTAKSEFLKLAARLAPRGLYTSGRGTTAAGLTAAVIRESTGMMMLEAGAVVLADLGVACIDEFDKMRTEDRNALHEAMEQQTVSVAKGGIVATLNARTSILAAANPLFGKYDSYRNIGENINLPIPLLTRFDLIFVLKDIPERTRDEQLAKHVLEQHRKGTFKTSPPIEFDLLKKYIAYAKNIKPILTPEAEEKILEYYLQMRSAVTESQITITPRQLESLIRLASARARILLREKVSEDDAIRAISLVQRMLETVGVDVRTGKQDFGVFHGRPMSERNLLITAIDAFKALEGTRRDLVDEKKYLEELVKTGKFKEDEARRILQALMRSGQIYEVKPGQYRRL